MTNILSTFDEMFRLFLAAAYESDISLFTELLVAIEILKNLDIRDDLNSRKPISKKSIASFLYEHQYDFAFIKYLDSLQPKLGSSFKLETGISPKNFQSLISLLSEDLSYSDTFIFHFELQKLINLSTLFFKKP